MSNTSPTKPSVALSLLPILLLVFLLYITIKVFGADALAGGSQICLLLAAGCSVAIGMFKGKVKWEKVEHAIGYNILGVAPALLILLLIGALSGSWMVSGIVPTLVYYGVQILSPEVFLASACIICSVVSVMTGSSWTTIATIGIALMGIGEALGFSAGWTAGAIVSGAYFGDKISPLSDTTVLSASVSQTPLFVHIKYMMLTTVPSVVISLIIFLLVGMYNDNAGVSSMSVYTETLDSRFNISLWSLVVPLITVLLIAKRVPSIIVLFISMLMAIVYAVIFQNTLLVEIAGEESFSVLSVFKGAWMVLFGKTNLTTGVDAIDSLISTRGMAGMLNTVWLILCAMAFGGAMTATKMLETITFSFTRFMKSRFSVVSSTVFAGLFLNVTTADQYISIILTGNMFKDVYKSKGLETRLLSRTTEDAVTVTSPLIPWTTCGMTQATILGVATSVYFPFCLFNIISPLMTLFMAAIGYKIKTNNVSPSDTV